MNHYCIVDKQTLDIVTYYQNDTPQPYGGPWGSSFLFTHIAVPEGLTVDTVKAVRDTTAGIEPENGGEGQEPTELPIILVVDEAKVELKLQATWKQLRNERNRLLAETDWSRIDDAPLSDAQREAFREYRQALRDLPDTTTDPANPAWPVKP